MNKNDARRFTISLDAFDIDADADQHDERDLLNAAPAVLIALAADAHATFTNVVAYVAVGPRFAFDIAFDFDATPADVARYLDAYDAPDDAIMPA